MAMINKQSVIPPNYKLYAICSASTAFHDDRKTKIRSLIGKGADINFKASDGNTPLHFAVIKNDEELVEIILDHKPDLLLKNNAEKTARDLAIDFGFKDIHELLENYKPSKAPYDDYNSKGIEVIYKFKHYKTHKWIKAFDKSDDDQSKKIVKFTKFSMMTDAVEFLQRESFKLTFKDSPHFFVIILQISDELRQLSTDEIEKLSEVFKDRSLILQLHSIVNGDVNFFWKEFNQQSFQVLKENLQLNDEEFKLSAAKELSFSLLIDALRSSICGKFDKNLLAIRFDFSDQTFWSFVLKYLLRQNQVLVLRFLLLHNANLSEKIMKDNDLLHDLAMFGKIETLKALFDFPFDCDEYNKFLINERQHNLINIKDEDGNLLLALAEKYGNSELMNYHKLYLTKPNEFWSAAIGDEEFLIDFAVMDTNIDLMQSIIVFDTKHECNFEQLTKNDNYEIVRIIHSNDSSSLIEMLCQNNFFESFERAEHCFIIDIVIQGAAGNFLEILNDLESKLITKCSLIVQIKNQELRKVLIASRSPDDESLIVFKQNFLPHEVFKSVETNCFDFNLVLHILQSGTHGSFHGDLLSIQFGEFEYFLDFAVRDGSSLTLKFVMLFVAKGISPKTWKNWFKTSASNGHKNVFKILQETFLKLNATVSRKSIINLKFDVEKKNLLCIAAESGQKEMVEYLIKSGFNVNYRDSNDQSASDYAINNLETLSILINNQAPFPKNFGNKSAGIEIDSAEMQQLNVKLELRKSFHIAIVTDNLELLKEFIEQNPKDKVCLNDEGKPALRVALEHKNLEIYALLLFKGFNAVDDEDYAMLESKLTIDEKNKISDYLIQFFGRKVNSHIILLYAKSRLGFDATEVEKAEFFDRIMQIYGKLNEMPEISPLLKVLQYSSLQEIVFDFTNDTIQKMKLTSSSYGICQNNGVIYIGAFGKADLELLGLIAHELCHYAMETLFLNDMNPYDSDDVQTKIKFDAIVREIRTNVHGEESLFWIRQVFDYAELDWPSEMIVRVPQLIANGKTNQLIEQCPKLFEFFNQIVAPVAVAFNENPSAALARLEVCKLNNLLGSFNDIKLLSIKDNKKLFDCSLKYDLPMIVTSNFPKLFLSRFFQTFRNKYSSTDKSCFIVTSFKNFEKQKLTQSIFNVWEMAKKSYLIVCCDNVSNKNTFLWRMMSELEITKRIIFVCANKKTAKLVIFFGKINESVKEHEVNFEWNSLAEETKTLLGSKEILFQGNRHLDQQFNITNENNRLIQLITNETDVENNSICKMIEHNDLIELCESHNFIIHHEVSNECSDFLKNSLKIINNKYPTRIGVPIDVQKFAELINARSLQDFIIKAYYHDQSLAKLFSDHYNAGRVTILLNLTKMQVRDCGKLINSFEINQGNQLFLALSNKETKFFRDSRNLTCISGIPLVSNQGNYMNSIIRVWQLKGNFAYLNSKWIEKLADFLFLTFHNELNDNLHLESMNEENLIKKLLVVNNDWNFTRDGKIFSKIIILNHLLHRVRNAGENLDFNLDYIFDDFSSFSLHTGEIGSLLNKEEMKDLCHKINEVFQLKSNCLLHFTLEKKFKVPLMFLLNIIKLLDRKVIKSILLQKDSQNKNVMHCALFCGAEEIRSLWITIDDQLTLKERKELLAETTTSRKLNFLMQYCATADDIMALKEVFTIVNAVSDNDYFFSTCMDELTAFDHAICFNQNKIIILEIWKQFADKFKMDSNQLLLMKTGKYKVNSFHRIAANVDRREKLNYFLNGIARKVLSKSEYKQFLVKTNNIGFTAFDYAVCFNDNKNIQIEICNEVERCLGAEGKKQMLLMNTGKYEGISFHRIAGHVQRQDNLNFFLNEVAKKAFLESEYKQFMIETNKDGFTALDYAVCLNKNRDIQIEIYKEVKLCLSVEERKRLLSKKAGTDERNSFHRVARHVTSKEDLKFYLNEIVKKVFSESEYKQFLVETDKNGWTALNYASRYNDNKDIQIEIRNEVERCSSL